MNIPERDLHLDSDGYPTEALLRHIAAYPYGNCEQFFYDLKDWWHPMHGAVRQDRELPHVWHVSTGGFSGNEEMIEAMSQNRMLWGITWVYSQRGGKYLFEIPKCKRAAS